MRRPAPIPASEEQARQSVRTESARDPVPLRGEASAVPDDETAPIDPIGPVVDPVAEVSGADVWRAARARRKALRAEIRRFTSRSRRRRFVWLTSIGAVLLVVLGTAAAAYSPLFAVEDISVVGAKSLDAQQVEQALSGQIGTPIALVDDSAVKSALMAFPLIETYALEVRPPHGLTVRIVERTPIGVLRSGAGYTLVDAAGVALATTDARPEGQPLLSITGGAGTPAFESAGLVVRSLPAEVRSALTDVRASTPDSVTLVLGDGRTVLWGSSEDSAAKSVILSKLMVNNPKSRTFDVSSPTVPVVG
ncbi:cell division protein [Microbacterium bovistercoris]|uniref:Cell division protein n=1 Tax=Microbacterium bovistercoris TaxID=2293570 RepID=A0A371NR32_9MICO|nr:FtsQ-type POTRA domain-containing protein [Microbacterium bovistercoris]REJ04622.1 cell division protein [Microbacterium bovistercoris]